MVSHDPLDMLPWADKLLIMQHGHVVQEGAPEVVYRKPVDAYVAGLFGAYNLLPASVASQFGIDLPKHRQLFLRPEDIRVSRYAGSSVNGEIIHTAYCGPYTELTLMVKEQKIVVRTTDHDFRVRELVGLSLSDSLPWLI
jgi:ABC-type Fe3+/spermidine/putrescine transport system ATPase subunit